MPVLPLLGLMMRHLTLQKVLFASSPFELSIVRARRVPARTSVSEVDIAPNKLDWPSIRCAINVSFKIN